MFPIKGVIDPVRFQNAMLAKSFFMSCYNADCQRIAIENPVPMKVIGLPKYTQIVQPYEHGHPYTKKTCLWLKGFSKLMPTKVLDPIGPYICGNSETWKKQAAAGVIYGKEKNAKRRSKTFPGIARAMAEQWLGEADKEEPHETLI